MNADFVGVDAKLSKSWISEIECRHMANLRVSDSLFRRRWEKEKNILCKELTPEAEEKLAEKKKKKKK